MLTHVNYRTGRMHDMAALTRAAHRGRRARWSGTWRHSAGAVPVDLAAACERRLRRRLRLQVPQRRPGRAGLRVGASAAHRAHGRDRCGSRCRAGWAMPRRSRSRPTIEPARRHRALPVRHPADSALAALECGVDTVLAAEPLGGMAALRAQVAGADRPVHRSGRVALRRPWPATAYAARARARAAARSVFARTTAATRSCRR